MNELKNRNREIKEKRRLMKQDDMYHGALEDILLGKASFNMYFLKLLCVEKLCLESCSECMLLDLKENG